jgi:hypothetical protein
MTQNKARRTNKVAFFSLPWAQEVSGSNPGAPTNPFLYLLSIDRKAAMNQFCLC